MTPLRRGRYQARCADGAGDVSAALALRATCFRPTSGQSDRDGLDDRCRHVLVEDLQEGRLVGCFRILPLTDPSRIEETYAAQHYGLEALTQYGRPMLELGRFCIAPDIRDPEVLRLAWAFLARWVDDLGAGLLFGCTSFRGADAENHLEAFALLKDRHIAPPRWCPGIKAPQVFPFAQKLASRQPDPTRALRAMPPLLRSYLALGGWVSDHAVIDRDLDTLHVFTALEIQAIPPGRARLLRSTTP